MLVQEITADNKNSYDDFVANNNGSFLQSWDWGEWQASNRRPATGYIVTNETGSEILAAQFLRYTLPLGQEYLYCPYGPVVATRDKESTYAKASADRQETSEGLSALIGHVREAFPKALFVRIEPTTSLQPTTYSLQPTLHIQPGSTILLDINKPEADLLAGMHPKTRYNIKVAQKHEVEIRLLEHPNDQHLAAQMMRDTLIRRKLVSPAQGYYFKLINHFSESSALSAHTYGAYYNSELVACALTLDYDHTRTYLFGGSSTAHKNVMAPYLLQWTIIRDAQKRKLTTYDWFGAEGAVSDGSGFARFKQSFGGDILQYAGAYDIIFKPLAYRAYQTTRHLNRWIRHK